jgi:opacity protein-like surface antigen
MSYDAGMTWPARARALLTLALGLAVTPSPIWAAGADEWQLAARAAFAKVAANGGHPNGPLVGIDLQYGLDDAWAARLSLESSWHGVSNARGKAGEDGYVRASSLTAGVTYAVDVMRLVPIFEIGIGLLDVGGAAAAAHRDFGIALGIGADYLLSEVWSLGVGARYQQFPLRAAGLTPNYDGDPTVFSLAIRAGRGFN